ncbi:MAG TPA: SDR family oxidoreductase [Legionella sp.]|nr:SDR family oxidoreductase [Legionella sp.]
MKLSNQTVWITGASSGIGEALAYEFARSGARLILSARTETELNRVKATCEHPERHHVVPLDLEQSQDLESLAQNVWNEFGPIDILVNNGGMSQRYKVADSSFKLDKKIMDVNFFGAVALTRPVLKNMLQRNSGQIVVISSMLGLYGIQTRSAYSASKHALRGYFESLRNELYQTSIGITLVYPGYVNTHITQNALLADGAPFGKTDSVHTNGIPPEFCAKKIVRGVEQRKPIIIVSQFKERFGAFIARFFPGLFRYLSPKFEV